MRWADGGAGGVRRGQGGGVGCSRGRGKSAKAFKPGSDMIRCTFLETSLIAACEVDWRGQSGCRRAWAL